MNVLAIGATGYLGSALCAALKSSGHSVLGSARSDAAANALRKAGLEPAAADISKPESLDEPAQSCDGVVYAVQYDGPDGPQVEAAALQRLVDALAGTGKPLLFTSGVWVYGDTGERAVDEQAVLNPARLVAHRPQLERIVLDGAARGVRSMVVRPGDVYGHGGGLPAMWVKSAKDDGASTFVGTGENHWAVVHVDDLADLYVRMITNGVAGAIFNACDATAFTVREMATVASTGAGRKGAVRSWPLDQARKALGDFADALALDSHVSSNKAREVLGWQCRSTTILDDLRSGSYRTEPATL